LRYGGGPGPAGLPRQFLHASQLRLDRASDGVRLRAWSELPPDLSACVEISGVNPTPGRLPVGVGAEVVPT
ncbi:MAG: hypothetical protein H0W98_09280, partial [Chloroflexi bacterium]|nr:hypothetical protein [Chloroflexota bacterium]